VKTTTYTPNRTVHRQPASVTLSLRTVKSGRHTLHVTVVFHKTVTRHRHRVTVSVSTRLQLAFRVC
jgi:hypothetical protein